MEHEPEKKRFDIKAARDGMGMAALVYLLLALGVLALVMNDHNLRIALAVTWIGGGIVCAVAALVAGFFCSSTA